MTAPGPRCASDIKKSLAKNKQRLAKAIAAGDDAAFNAADSERVALQFEYAGTKKGQKALTEQIAATTDPEVRDDLEAYKARARQVHVEKVERLRAQQEAATQQFLAAFRPPAPSPSPSASSYTNKYGK